MAKVHTQTEEPQQETSSLYVSGLYWLTWISLTHRTGEDSSLIELLSALLPPNIVLNLYPSLLPGTIYISLWTTVLCFYYYQHVYSRTICPKYKILVVHIKVCVSLLENLTAIKKQIYLTIHCQLWRNVIFKVTSN